jgi:hypothetical protein
MTGLTPGQRYYYKVGNKNGANICGANIPKHRVNWMMFKTYTFPGAGTDEAWSKVFSFKAATTEKPKPGDPELHLIC